MITHTSETGTLGMRPEVSQAMNELRSFLFARVYKNPVAKGEESKARGFCKPSIPTIPSTPRRFPPTSSPSWTSTACPG